jgi:hypothetical protein
MRLVEVAAQQTAANRSGDEADRAADNGMTDHGAADATGHCSDGAIPAATTVMTVIVMRAAVIDVVRTRFRRKWRRRHRRTGEQRRQYNHC